MFPGINPGEWEPLKIRTKTVTTQKPVPPPTNGQVSKPDIPNGDAPPSTDVEMQEAPAEAAPAEVATAPEATVPIPAQEEPLPKPTDETLPDAPKVEPEEPTQEIPAQIPQDGETVAQEEAAPEIEEEITEVFEDDHWSVQGAIYPIREGRIENWSCFFALLSHIYNMISPPFHMPVLFISQPCWSSRDKEMITQYVFENWKIPAFCLMDAALTAAYAYGVPTALVVDVGHGKSDVTAVTDFQINDAGRGVAISQTGGEAMTKRLQQLLADRGFNDDMAEQLKRSPICEILPLGYALPTSTENGVANNPAAAASTGALDSGSNIRDTEGLRPGQAPRGPGFGTAVGEENGTGENDDDDGVLDVAAIVARDNAAELLAKREKEKAERAAAKKGGAAEPPRPARLRNSEKTRASFTYVELLPIEDTEDETAIPTARKRKREVEVGLERFKAATPGPGYADGVVDTLAEAIHHTALSVPEVPLRSALWDNLIILGNGSRIRGKKDHMRMSFYKFLTQSQDSPMLSSVPSMHDMYYLLRQPPSSPLNYLPTLPPLLRHPAPTPRFQVKAAIPVILLEDTG